MLLISWTGFIVLRFTLLHVAETPDVETPGAETPGAETFDAEMPVAESWRSNPTYTNKKGQRRR